MTPQSLTLGEAVLLIWHDSFAHSGWSYDAEKLTEVAEIQSLGFVVNSSKESLVITTSIALNRMPGAVADALVIPWGAIQKLDLLPNEFKSRDNKPLRGESPVGVQPSKSSVSSGA